MNLHFVCNNKINKKIKYKPMTYSLVDLLDLRFVQINLLFDYH